MAAGGSRAGTGYVEIRPELVRDFSRQLERDLGRKVGPVDVPVEPDVDGGGQKLAAGIGKWDAAIGGAAMGVGAAAGKFIVDGMANWIEEDKGASRIAASLGLDSKGKATIERVARDVYVSGLGGSLADAQEAVSAVGGSMVDLNTVGEAEAGKLAKSVLAISDAFGIEIPRATNVAQLAVENGLVGSSMEALDLLAAALVGVPADATGDFMDAVEEYTPFFKQMGFTGEEAFGVISKSAKKGKYSLDKTSDALKEFQIRGQDGSKLTADSFGKLGLNAEEMSKKIAAGGPAARTAFGQVMTALLGMKDPLAQSQAAVGLFGTQFEDLASIDALAALQPIDNALGQTEGKATELGSKITDNTSGAFDRAMRSMETDWTAGLDRIVESPGESMGALVEAFETGLGGLGETFGGWFDTVEEAFGEIPGWLGGLWENIEDLLGKIPEGLGAAFDGVEELLFGGIKRGWTAIAEWWNSLEIPQLGPWDMGPYQLGPFGPFSLPDIPTFDDGGVVPGKRGSAQLVVAHGGETVLPTHKGDLGGGGGSGGVRAGDVFLDGQLVGKHVAPHVEQNMMVSARGRKG